MGDEPPSVGRSNNTLTTKRGYTIEPRGVPLWMLGSLVPSSSHCIDTLNNNPNVNGIIVQLPLPSHLDTLKITNRVNIEKDVDGFLPNSPFVPCTALGVVSLIEELEIDVNGKLVVVLGRSEFIGKRIADMLLAKNATVAICHSKTTEETRKTLLANADIVIAAVGKAELFMANDVKPNAIVIDIGINKTEKGLCGDFVPPKDENYCDYTTVPGGVGLLTRAMLLKNTATAKQNQEKTKKPPKRKNPLH